MAVSLLAISSLALATDDTQEIRLSVIGAESNTGQILISLFDSHEDFLVAPMLEMKVDVDSNGSASVSLGKHARGEYAIAVVYDKNRNGKLDTGVFRIPKEKIGFSNNPSSRFGPAKWGEARFLVADSHTLIEIRLGNVDN